MEKATNKDAFKKYREREQQRQQVPGQVGNIKRKMMPLLVEGTQLKYVPWGGRDVETLQS